MNFSFVFADGSSVSPSRRIKVNSSNGSLIITSAQAKLDEGNYQCALVTVSSQPVAASAPSSDNQSEPSSAPANNNDNQPQHHQPKHRSRRWRIMKLHQFELALIEAPRLAPFEFPADATVGMRVLITCSILRGQKPISFVWLKDNQIIASIQHQSSVSNIGDLQPASSLSLGQLHRQQLAESRLSLPASSKGLHQQVGSGGAKLHEHARLDYVIYNQASESPIVQQTTLLRQQQQQSMSLQSKLSDSTTMNENQLLALLSDPSIKIKSSDDYSILSIENLELKHSGRYTCSAYNEAARVSHSSQLLINGKLNLSTFTAPLLRRILIINVEKYPMW